MYAIARARTEDATIATSRSLLGTGQIKTGAPARRTASRSNNQLIRIEEKSSASRAIYPGWTRFRASRTRFGFELGHEFQA